MREIGELGTKARGGRASYASWSCCLSVFWERRVVLSLGFQVREDTTVSKQEGSWKLLVSDFPTLPPTTRKLIMEARPGFRCWKLP